MFFYTGGVFFYLKLLEKNASKCLILTGIFCGKKVTVAVDGKQPAAVMPLLANIQPVYYKTGTSADYVLVPYFNVFRLWFPENELQGR